MEFCSESKDGHGHCVCWWESEPCCWCGHNEGDVDGEARDEGEHQART